MTAAMKLRKSSGLPMRISGDLRLETLQHVRPQAVRYEGTARGRALLPLIFESTAHERDHERVDVGARMREDEVLAARLADQPRVAAIALDVLADGAPERLKHAGAAGEMNAGEMGTREDLRAIARRHPARRLMTPGGRPARRRGCARSRGRCTRRSPPASRSRRCPASRERSEDCRRWR